MSRLRSPVLASVCALGAGALMLVACSGQVLSLGTNKTASQLVDPSTVTGTVPACGASSAHPNVCCTAGPNEPSTCVVYPGAPFTQCAAGAATYPDPRSCCPLDGSGACSAPPPVADDAGISIGGGGCAYACPPGWYPPPNASGNECCQTSAGGATECSASGGGGGGSSGGVPCGCPACVPDVDGSTASCPPCDCPPTPSPSSCGTCPSGWQVPQGSPDLCCTTDPSGDIACFSQAGPPGSPAPLDAGLGPAGCFGGGNGTDGSAGLCGCQEQANGHTYAVNCDPGTNLCSCTVDNGAPTKSFPANGNTCGNSVSLFATCGYP